ncbi:hypothetical protein DsansV1_C16g0139781 [Dioscorea sansibarensis]
MIVGLEFENSRDWQCEYLVKVWAFIQCFFRSSPMLSMACLFFAGKAFR